MGASSGSIERLLRASRLRELEADSPEHARTAQVVVDTLAVIARGMDDPTCREYADAVGWRRGRARTPEESAVVNALPTTVLQMDEGHRESRGHPAIHIVPAAIAVATEIDATGSELLAAVLSGYEAAVEVGLTLGAMPPDSHPHGSWAAFGAAVAAANLWGASEGQRLAVLEAVSSRLVRGMRGPEHSGASVHHFYAPVAAQAAITLARAAVHGMAVQPGAFEDYYVPALKQSGPPRETPTQRGTLAILENYFKFYAACGHTHTALRAFATLVEEHGLDGSDVASVTVGTYRAAAALAGPPPRTNLAARFHTPFLLARILTAGDIGYGVFTEADLTDERTRDIAQRITMEHVAEFEPYYPESRPARVTIQTTDGSTVTAEMRHSFGDVTNPAPFDVWRDKIRGLLGEEVGDELSAFVGRSSAEWTARELLDAVWPEA